MANPIGEHRYLYMSEPISKLLENRNTTPGSLNRPHDIKVLNNGDFVIADKCNNRVVVTDRKYEIKLTLPKPPKGRFDPYGIAINGTDILVTDNTGRIVIYRDDAIYRTFGHDYLERPTGIAVLNNKIYVVDFKLSCIKVCNLEGNVTKTIPKHGLNSLDEPWFCTFNSMGQLLVADANNHRIQVLEPEIPNIPVVRSIPVKVGDKPMMPRGIAVDANDTIFVTAMERVGGIFPCLQCVVVYTQDGIPLGSFGDSAGFYWPRGITVINGNDRKALITNDHSIKEIKL